MDAELIQYSQLLAHIKDRTRHAQVKATLSANSEMILMYWDIGRMIHERQQHEGWGAKVVPKLAQDIRNELPEVKGFSQRNLKRMIAFYREYPLLSTNVPQLVAQLPTGENERIEKVPQPVAQLPDSKTYGNLQQLVVRIPWGRHILAHGKGKRPFCSPLVHAPDYRTEMKQECPGVDDQEQGPRAWCQLCHHQPLGKRQDHAV
jgi:hypothetical protein